MMKNTIGVAAWAEAEAPKLSAEDWQQAEREANRLSRSAPYGDPIERWSLAQARALIAHRGNGKPVVR